MERAGCEVRWEVLAPRQDYPFPWTLGEFFGVFSACVLGEAPGIDPLPGLAPSERIDLVVLCSQVWFLAPSLPVQAFLGSAWAGRLRDVPVVTLIACRNMWHTASEQIKRRLRELGARHLDNIVATDNGPPLATFVTTPRWLLTGRKEGFWRFPPAGISDDDIAGLARFGEALATALGSGRPLTGSVLRGLQPVQVDERFVLTELIGWRNFRVMAKFLKLTGLGRPAARIVGLPLFVAWLVVSVLILVPLGVLGRLLVRLLVKPAFESYIRRLCEPSG
jgi:hypothetical protein